MFIYQQYRQVARAGRPEGQEAASLAPLAERNATSLIKLQPNVHSHR